MGSNFSIVDSNIFPAPEPSYGSKSFNEPASLHAIPSTFKLNDKEKHEIPLLFIQHKERVQSSQYLIYFHGNAEDIGLSLPFLYQINESLKVNVVAVEYPGYGIYQSRKTTAECIKSDALSAFDYVTSIANGDQKNVILLGRSIGSGPASYVASKRTPRAVLLISAYTSVNNLIGDHFNSCVKPFISERFDNLSCMNTITSPVLLIHGLKDTLIKPKNSQDLENALVKQQKVVKAIFHPYMTHNDFDLQQDILYPIKKFLEEH